mgnify:CR=1 FL=1
MPLTHAIVLAGHSRGKGKVFPGSTGVSHTFLTTNHCTQVAAGLRLLQDNTLPFPRTSSFIPPHYQIITTPVRMQALCWQIQQSHSPNTPLSPCADASGRRGVRLAGASRCKTRTRHHKDDFRWLCLSDGDVVGVKAQNQHHKVPAGPACHG